MVYGSEDFIKEVAEEYKVDAVIKPKGRPLAILKIMNSIVASQGAWPRLAEALKSAKERKSKSIKNIKRRLSALLSLINSPYEKRLKWLKIEMSIQERMKFI